MAIQWVGVMGAGTMGNGIAHVLARCGFNVVLCDVEQRFLDRGLATIAKNLDREVAKNKITADDKVSTLGRITGVVERAKLGDCDLVIEAATEKFEVKTEIFRDLDRMMTAGGDSGHEHVFDFDHENCGADRARRQGHWHALLQSRAGDEAGRSDSRLGDIAGHV